MFDYTKAAFDKTINDFKRLDYIRQVLTQLVYIAYLIYALIAAKDFLWANIPLLVLSVAYFVFFLYATTGKKQSRAKDTVQTVYKYCKRLIKLFTLGVTVYGFFLTANNVTPISLLFVALMIVGWILELVFDLIGRLFINRVNLFKAGLDADYHELMKPAKTVGNFFKKITGQEIEPEQEPTKNRIILEKQLVKSRQAALKKKQEKRLEKQRLKEEKKRKKAEKPRG